MLSAACKLASASRCVPQWIDIISLLCFFNWVATPDDPPTVTEAPSLPKPKIFVREILNVWQTSTSFYSIVSAFPSCRLTTLRNLVWGKPATENFAKTTSYLRLAMSVDSSQRLPTVELLWTSLSTVVSTQSDRTIKKSSIIICEVYLAPLDTSNSDK